MVEIISGATPFTADNPEGVYEKIA